MNGAEKKHSVLIVDDEAANLSILTHILDPEYSVYTAKDGETALAIAREAMPDLILLDIVMPDMDGYAVFSALKASDATRDIPVLFITGLSISEDQKKRPAMQAADYVSKPFSVESITEKVRSNLRRP
jgi:putative two-component system response regulator